MKNTIEQINLHFKYVTICINALLNTIQNNDFNNIIDVCLEVIKSILEFKQYHNEFITLYNKIKNDNKLDLDILNIYNTILNLSIDDYQFETYMDKIMREFEIEFNNNFKDEMERDFKTLGPSCIQNYSTKFLYKLTNIKIKVSSHADYLIRTNNIDNDIIQKIIKEKNKLINNYKKYLFYIQQYIYLSTHNIKKDPIVIKIIIKKQNNSKTNCIKNINNISNLIYSLIKSKPYLFFDICFMINNQISNNWMNFFMKYYNQGLTIMDLYNKNNI